MDVGLFKWMVIVQNPSGHLCLKRGIKSGSLFGAVGEGVNTAADTEASKKRIQMFFSDSGHSRLPRLRPKASPKASEWSESQLSDSPYFAWVLNTLDALDALDALDGVW